MEDDWQETLKPVKIDSKQASSILKGKSEAYSGKLKLYNIFGKIPDTIWDVRHTEKFDMGERTQHEVAKDFRNDTLKIFDSSTRNQNVRNKGAISIFPAQILDQLLQFYTAEGDTFFDPFAGHNSRMERSFENKRHYIGYDISHEFMTYNEEVKKKLIERSPHNKTSITLKEKDSRLIDEPDNSVDFIFSSPPYWDLEWYGDEEGQLGNLTYEQFMKDITDIYKQCYRILKPGKFCLININDFRKGGKYYSYHTDTIKALNEAGFSQYDLIIMKYANSMRKSFPNQIMEEKLMPKTHEFICVFFKEPSYPHSAVFPFSPKKAKI